jgi:hypothetical protein
VRTGSSYLSQSETAPTTGLGAATIIERMEVLWPSSSREAFTVDGVDRVVTLRAGSGSPQGG